MRPPRWVLAVVGAALAVAAADAGILLATHDGTPSARADSRAPKNRVVVIDPRKQKIVDSIDVGRQPTAVVTGFGGVWVLNRGEGTLSHIDGRTHQLLGTIGLDEVASDVTVGRDGVWVAGPPRGGQQPLEVSNLERIDPKTGAVDRQFVTSTGAFVLAAGGGALWTTGYLGNGVRGAAHTDALTGEWNRVDIEIYGDLVAADDRAAYWVGSIASRVARVSTRTGRLTASMPLATDESLAQGLVPPNPTDVALGGGALWISTTDGTLIRVDPKLRGIVAHIPVCHNALGVAYGLGAVWVACSDAVVRVDPETDEPAERIEVEGLPRAVAAGEGAVWVTVT